MEDGGWKMEDGEDADEDEKMKMEMGKVEGELPGIGMEVVWCKGTESVQRTCVVSGSSGKERRSLVRVGN